MDKLNNNNLIYDLMSLLKRIDMDLSYLKRKGPELRFQDRKKFSELIQSFEFKKNHIEKRIHNLTIENMNSLDELIDTSQNLLDAIDNFNQQYSEPDTNTTQ